MSRYSCAELFDGDSKSSLRAVNFCLFLSIGFILLICMKIIETSFKFDDVDKVLLWVEGIMLFCTLSTMAVYSKMYYIKKDFEKESLNVKKDKVLNNLIILATKNNLLYKVDSSDYLAISLRIKQIFEENNMVEMKQMFNKNEFNYIQYISKDLYVETKSEIDKISVATNTSNAYKILEKVKQSVL